jgi:hypothetical protein
VRRGRLTVFMKGEADNEIYLIELAANQVK